MGHSILAPSASDRWTVCTASVAEVAKLPEPPTSEYAAEGTRAHEVLDWCIKNVTRPLDFYIDPESKYAKELKDALPFVQKAYDLVATYINDPRAVVLSEVEVVLNQYCYGTVDIVVIIDNQLIIIDYKHGRGVLVEPDCTQLLIYAVAAHNTLSFMFTTPIEQITRIIVQPRATHPSGPIRQVSDTTENTINLCNHVVQSAIDTIYHGQPQFEASEKGCRWCPVKDSKQGCETFQNAALKSQNSYFEPVSNALVVPPASAVDGMNIQQIASFLEGEGLFDIYRKAMYKRAMQYMKEGQNIPGFTLDHGDKKRVFTFEDDKEYEEFLTKECKLKKTQIWKQTRHTPAQVEKLIDVKKRNGSAKMEKLQSKIIKPKGDLKIVPLKDGQAPFEMFEALK